MLTFDGAYDRNQNQYLDTLIKENPKVEESIIKRAISICGSPGDQVLENVEIVLSDIPNMKELLNVLRDIYSYSNLFALYSVRVTEESGVEAVVQLTVKDPDKIRELDKKHYVTAIKDVELHAEERKSLHLSSIAGEEGLEVLTEYQSKVEKS